VRGLLDKVREVALDEFGVGVGALLVGREPFVEIRAATESLLRGVSLRTSH